LLATLSSAQIINMARYHREHKFWDKNACKESCWLCTANVDN